MTQKKCKIIINNEVSCRILGLQLCDSTSLWNTFGFYMDGYRYAPQYQLGRWDGKVRFFDMGGKTYTKLLDEIVPYICNWNYEIELIDHRIPVKVIEDRINANYFDSIKTYEEGEPKITLRPYQVDSVNAAFENGSGFIIAGTGSGKTLICAAMSSVLEKNGFRTLVIVPSSDLVTQTADEFIRCGLDVGEYSGYKKDIEDKNIVVGTWQSLQNAPHEMRNFNAVIVDEAHGTKATIIRQLINDNGGHIAYRFGVTGTFPKPITDQYTLKSSIGTIIKEIPVKWLIENGFLSEVLIEPIMILEGENFDLPDYTSERSMLSKNERRLRFIASIIEEKRKQYGNTLVLTSSIPQGQQLEEMIEGSIFLWGESEKDLRLQNYQQYAERNDVIVIASSGIASTGISIDRIFCLILVDAQKSFIRAIQSIGRSLRKKGDKNKAYVIDIFSSLKWSKKHSKERQKYYKEAGYPMTHQISKKYKTG